MIRVGTFRLNVGISRLDNTRLARAPLSDDTFDRATIFLRQDRQLNPDETIFVDGVDDHFGEIPVIVITDAGRVVPAITDVGAGADTVAVAPTKASHKGSGTKSTKKVDAKKPGSKKSAKGSAKKSAKRPAKNSAKKKSRKASGKEDETGQ